MKLHQLLRLIHSGMNIIIYNLKGIPIVSVRDKESISTDLYDYDVIEINVGLKDIKNKESAFFITITI